MSELIRENEYVVSKNQTVSGFLEDQCPFFSEGEYLEILFQDRLVLRGTPITSLNQSLVSGDVIVLKTPQSLEPKVNLSYDVVFEDEYLFVVNKPAHLPIHPAGKFYFNTLTHILSQSGFESSYPINRLDKETSGLVVFAKSKEFASKLQLALSDAKKVYEVIAFGKTEKLFEIDAPLEKMLVGEIRDHMVVLADGLASKTSFLTLSQNDEFSHLMAFLHTGRRHQIRAHLAHVGHPVVGDKQYGFHPEVFVQSVQDPLSYSDDELVSLLGASRQLLHCSSLEFLHPITGDNLFFEAKKPADFINFLKRTGF